MKYSAFFDSDSNDKQLQYMIKNYGDSAVLKGLAK